MKLKLRKAFVYDKIKKLILVPVETFILLVDTDGTAKIDLIISLAVKTDQ
jgi:hypothetical protein